MSGSISTNMNMSMQHISNSQQPALNNDYYDSINRNIRENIDSKFIEKIEQASGAIASKFPEPTYKELPYYDIPTNPFPAVPQASASINTKFSVEKEKDIFTNFEQKPIQMETIIRTVEHEQKLGLPSGALQTKLFEKTETENLANILNKKNTKDFYTSRIDNSPILPTLSHMKKEFDPINVLDTLKKENSKIKTYDDFDYKPRDYGSLKVDNSPILPTFNSVKKEFDPINVLDTLKKENSKIKMYDDFDYKPHDFNNLKSNKETTIPILNHLKKEKEDVFIPMNFEKKSYTPKTIMPEYIIPKPVTPDPVIIEPYIPKPIIQEPIKIEPKIKNYIDLIQDTVPNIKTDNDFKIQPIKTKPTINYLNNDDYIFNKIGTHSDFNTGSKNNIKQNLGFGLQERFDFSGHGSSEPHVNYDLLINKYSNTKKKFKPLSKNPLGDAHYKNLF